MYKNNLKTQLQVSVYIEKNREFKKPIEFERENYFVKENSNKRIILYAKYPDFIDEKNIKLNVSNSNQKAISAPSTVNLKHVDVVNQSY